MFGNDFYAAYVRGISNATPSMRRVVIGGGDLSRFQSRDFPDEFVRLLFVPVGSRSAVLPCRENKTPEKWSYPEGIKEPPGRYYTVRNWNRHTGEMTIDFAVHEGGVAAAWATSAKVGDAIGVTTSNGRYALPDKALWLLILTDITGLPAVGRILDERPKALRVLAHIEVPDHADRQPLEEGVETLNWYYGFGSTPRISRLSEIARSIELPQGAGYIWIAGEAQEVSEARKFFRDELRFDKDRIDAIGYWIEGRERS